MMAFNYCSSRSIIAVRPTLHFYGVHPASGWEWQGPIFPGPLLLSTWYPLLMNSHQPGPDFLRPAMGSEDALPPPVPKILYCSCIWKSGISTNKSLSHIIQSWHWLLEDPNWQGCEAEIVIKQSHPKMEMMILWDFSERIRVFCLCRE